MEYTKATILSIKEAIKTLVEEQRQIKPQRKTVNFSGTRKLPAWQATQQHQINRYDLRHLYIAYGIVRGRSVDQIEPKRKREYNEKKVALIIAKYETVCNNA